MFLLLFLSTGLTVCYSFRLIYFVMCGVFNFVPSYSMVETSYNMMFGMIGLLIMSVFGGSSLMWLVCPTPSIICSPYYLSFLTLFMVFMGGWLGYSMAGFAFGDSLISVHLYSTYSFVVSMWFMPFFSTYDVSFGPLGIGYSTTKVFNSVGWNILVVSIYIGYFLILVSLIIGLYHEWNQGSLEWSN